MHSPYQPCIESKSLLCRWLHETDGTLEWGQFVVAQRRRRGLPRLSSFPTSRWLYQWADVSICPLTVRWPLREGQRVWPWRRGENELGIGWKKP